MMSVAPVAYGIQHEQSGQLVSSSQMQSQQQIVHQPPLPAANDPKIHTLILELTDPITRESALLELSKKREQYDDLALVLWHSFGMLPRACDPAAKCLLNFAVQGSWQHYCTRSFRFIRSCLLPL